MDGIVSFIIKYLNFEFIASNGIPILPFAQKDVNQKNENSTTSTVEENSKEKKNESGNCAHKEHENIEPTMMIGTPIFFSNMPKYCYNKLYKRKQKPFTEREGDWICNSCKNLNFAFRVECNRCKLPKGSDAKTNKGNEEKDKNKENNQEKAYQRGQRHNKHKKNYNYYYNNKNNGNEAGKK